MSPEDVRRAAPAREQGASQARAPVVWIQAGHVGPREPGYAAQTGAAAGAYGSEIGFTRILARKVVTRLRAAGVNARLTPGKVTPLAARGAVFVSLHYDVPTGRALIGHAVTGGGENYYHGEGFGTPSPTPYADSAPHRRATTVSPAVAARSRELARRLARRYRTAFTPAHGARTTFGGVQTPTANPRVMHYYGFYRTRAGARVLIECGAGVTDDRFLRRTGLISRVVSAGVLDYLRARRLR
ncbi:MAG: N-acetylmuramoyl-L-alanine amidase [Actinobacteria bacterium]|nr:N-acetylmuramoyl-L-alanine amidase [Thermoleophilia bacterium]MCB9010697.1 N-acetylmuramoyl-L-alanine amidase [Actinomycetota bacterium]